MAPGGGGGGGARSTSHHSTKRWRAASTWCFPRNVMAVMLFSTATSYASSGGQAVLYMYFHEHMKWSDSNATAGVSFYIAAAQIFGIMGALGSDHWLGKIRMQMFTGFMWIIGGVAMLLSVLPGIDASHGFGTAMALLGLGLVNFGNGAMSPSQAAFVGDQASTLADVSKFYSFYYFAQNVGSLGGELGCPLLREHVSFVATFATVLASVGLAMVFFFWGRPVFVRNEGDLPSERGEYTKCSPVLAHYTREDRAGLCRVLKIFAPLPAYWALFYQQNSSWITQTSMMNTSLIWHTSDILAGFEDLCVCIFVPLFAVCLYPALSRVQWLTPTPLRKMGVGMIATFVSFICAGFVQVAISKAPANSVSVAWQFPQFVLIAVAETLVAVTGLEFAFTQCGPNTQSLVQALWNVMQLGQVLTGVIAKLKLGTLEQDFFFYAGLMVVFLIVFWLITWNYQYHEPESTAHGEAARLKDGHGSDAYYADLAPRKATDSYTALGASDASHASGAGAGAGASAATTTTTAPRPINSSGGRDVERGTAHGSLLRGQDEVLGANVTTGATPPPHTVLGSLIADNRLKLGASVASPERTSLLE